MATDSEILNLVRLAFADCPRPEHFTNYRHCDECYEHDELLRSRDLDSLRIEDVGNPGWDPICFITTEGFGYYFPALARLALETSFEDWYVPQLLFHLTHDGPRNRRWEGCTNPQRAAIAGLLRHVIETRAEWADGHYQCADDLFRTLEIWEDSV